MSRKTLGTILIIAGISMIVYFGYTYVYTGIVQSRLSKDFSSKADVSDDKPKVDDMTATEPKIDPADQKYYDEIRQSNAFAKLVIPKINLDVIVVQDTDTESLKKGPGHIKASALPGEVGNCAISGHRVTYGAPFRNIDQLQPGDAIIVYTPHNRFVYEVYAQKVVLPDDVSVIQPTSDSQLTLTACHPPHSAKYRLIIQSRLVGKPII